jgi:hypothetical protein
MLVSLITTFNGGPNFDTGLVWLAGWKGPKLVKAAAALRWWLSFFASLRVSGILHGLGQGSATKGPIYGNCMSKLFIGKTLKHSGCL